MEKAVFDIQDKYDFYEDLKRFQLPYKVKVEPIFRPRDHSANKYYWKIIVGMLADYLGYFIKLEMHEILLVLFSLVEIRYENGVVLYVVKSTSGMSSVEFEQYMEKIRIWALTPDGLSFKLPVRGEDFIDDEEKTRKIKR